MMRQSRNDNRIQEWPLRPEFREARAKIVDLLIEYLHSGIDQLMADYRAIGGSLPLESELAIMQVEEKLRTILRDNQGLS